MKPLPPGPFKRVSGPTPKGSNGLQVTVITLDGKRHTRSFTDTRLAHSIASGARAELLADADKASFGKGKAYRKFDGTATWWSEMLAQAAKDAYESPTDTNLARLRSLSQGAKAAQAHVDVSQFEARMEAVEKWQDQRNTADKHGAGAKRQTRSSRKKPKAGSKIS